MSRARIGYALAFFGILITTGGCSSSATAPEAANIEASAARGKKSTPADSMSAKPTTGGEDGYTTLSGGLLNGGGRSADAP